MDSSSSSSSWVRKDTRISLQVSLSLSLRGHNEGTAISTLHFSALSILCFFFFLQSWRTSPARTTTTATPFKSFSQRRRALPVRRGGLLSPRSPTKCLSLRKGFGRSVLWMRSSEQMIWCKMGNKQTIFTDEQLDAYQVRHLQRLHSTVDHFQCDCKC